MSGNLLMLWDLDGTLADIQHRAHYLKQSPAPWPEFFSHLRKDKPIMQSVALFNMAFMNGVAPYRAIVTSRPEAYRAQTERWLASNRLTRAALHMRGDHDHRPAPLQKLEVLQKLRKLHKWSGIIAFDDQPAVVQMYRDEGILCYQTAEGGAY